MNKITIECDNPKRHVEVNFEEENVQEFIREFFNLLVSYGFDSDLIKLERNAWEFGDDDLLDKIKDLEKENSRLHEVIDIADRNTTPDEDNLLPEWGAQHIQKAIKELKEEDK